MGASLLRTKLPPHGPSGRAATTKPQTRDQTSTDAQVYSADQWRQACAECPAGPSQNLAKRKLPKPRETANPPMLGRRYRNQLQRVSKMIRRRSVSVCVQYLNSHFPISRFRRGGFIPYFCNGSVKTIGNEASVLPTYNLRARSIRSRFAIFGG